MDYSLFKQKIHDIINLDLNSYKEQQMQRRIRQWITRHSLNDFSELIRVLKTDLKHRRAFLDYLTINTSRFFRDETVFNFIEHNILPTISHNNRARIWSAGCSIGAEIYSVVILLLEHRLYVQDSLATDIDEYSLNQAKKGVYVSNQVDLMPKHCLRKYFDVKDNRYYLKSSVKDRVKFKRHNLLTDHYDRDFDLILCRNVFIYFTNEIQQWLIRKFVASLKPKGFFIVGSAEHIINPSQFGLTRTSYCVYQKQ